MLIVNTVISFKDTLGLISEIELLKLIATIMNIFSLNVIPIY